MGRVRRERKSKVVKDPSADQSVTVTSKIEDGTTEVFTVKEKKGDCYTF